MYIRQYGNEFKSLVNYKNSIKGKAHRAEKTNRQLNSGNNFPGLYRVPLCVFACIQVRNNNSLSMRFEAEQIYTMFMYNILQTQERLYISFLQLTWFFRNAPADIQAVPIQNP